MTLDISIVLSFCKHFSKNWLYFHQEARWLLLSYSHLKTFDHSTKLTTSSTTNSLSSVTAACRDRLISYSVSLKIQDSGNRSKQQSNLL
jgi:hypothetical protein